MVVKQKPAAFLMRNSQGYPDFIMTMLVYFSVALFILLLFWIGFQYLAFKITYSLQGEATHPFVEFCKSFNDTIRLIVLGVSSTIFGLAGSYMLRRKFKDDHYIQLKQQEIDLGGKIADATGFIGETESTLSHSNYDDEEEDI